MAKDAVTTLEETRQKLIKKLVEKKRQIEDFKDNFPDVKIVKASPQLKPRRKSAEKIIKQSLMRYSTSKEKTNEKIRKFLASSA